MISILADILMGNDSPFADKNIKRPELSQASSMVIV
jgi:hypothetical protein